MGDIVGVRGDEGAGLTRGGLAGLEVEDRSKHIASCRGSQVLREPARRKRVSASAASVVYEGEGHTCEI